MQYQADLGGPGPGPGDQFVFAGDVLDGPGGAVLGTIGGSCTTLTGDNTSGQTACNSAFNLAGGQIVIEGMADTAPSSVAVGSTRTPGSGTVQVPMDVPNQTDANFVLNLTG